MNKKIKKGYRFPMPEALGVIPEHYQFKSLSIKKLFAVLYYYSGLNNHMAFTLGQKTIASDLGIDRRTVFRQICELNNYYDYIIYQIGRVGCNSIFYIVKPDEDRNSIDLRTKMTENMLNIFDNSCPHGTKSSQSIEDEGDTEKMSHGNSDGTFNPNVPLIYNNIINKKENINYKKEMVKQQYTTLPLEVSDQIGNVVVNSENNNFKDMKQTIDSLELQVKELQLENEHLKKENQYLNKRLTKAKEVYWENVTEIKNLKATIDQQQSNQQAPLAVVVSSSYNLLIKQFYNSLNVDTERAKGFLEQLNKLTDLDTHKQEEVVKANNAYKKKIEDKQKTTTQSNSIIPDDLLDEAAILVGKCKRCSNTDEILQYSPDEVEQTMDRLIQVQKELREKHKYLKGRKDWQAAIYNRELGVFITSPKNDLCLPNNDCVYFNNLKVRVAQMRDSKPLKSVAFVQHPGLD